MNRFLGCMAVTVALVSGCNSGNSVHTDGDGTTKDVQSMGSAPGSQKETPSTAPQAASAEQGRYGQTGTNMATQIIFEGGKELPTGMSAADTDLYQRVVVAITTGSTGTQGRIDANMLSSTKVTIADGVVTLSGSVKSTEESKNLEKLVTGLEGVKSVNNQLVLGGKPPERTELGIFPRSQANEK